MQFTISAAFLALIGSAFAQTANFDAITAPTKNQELVADGKQSYKITWEPTVEYNGQAVSILLLQGASQDTLDFYPGAKVASSIDSALGTFTWTPDSSIAGYATYGLKLQLDSNTTIFQYSFPFQITAGSGSTTTSTVSSSSTTLSSVASKTSAASTSSSTAATSTSSDENADGTTSGSVSMTSSTLAPTGASGAQTTLTTATKPSSTGSATSSSTAAVVTAGAGRLVAGGFAAIGGGLVAAMLAL